MNWRLPQKITTTVRAWASFSCFILLAVAPHAMAATASTFDRREWIADFEYLKHSLESSYSHLAWFGSPESGVDLPGLEQRTMRALRYAKSNDDAAAAITSFVQGFHDPHFALTQTPEAAEDFAEPAVRSLDADPIKACAAYGYAPLTRIGFALPFESLEGFTLESDGIDMPFRSGTIDVGAAKFGIIRIPRFRAAEYPALCIDVWKALRATGVVATAEDVANDVNAAWLNTLAARLRRLRELQADAIIVDVGDDGGGNDLGDWAVRAFASKPVHSARLLVSAGPAGVAYLNEQIDNLQSAATETSDLDDYSRQALFEAIDAFKRRKASSEESPCDMSWVWRERRSWEASACRRLSEAGFASGHADFIERGAIDPRIAPAIYWASNADAVRGAWEGPVYLLTNGKTASAAEMFAALMQDAVGATLVGERTAGLGCGFMASGAPIVLPNSRLSFSVPNCVRLRADGTDEVAGVTPEIRIAPRAGESARARAARLLDALATANAGQPQH